MKPEPGLRILIYFLSKQARAEGFLVYQFADRYPEGMAQMAKWIKEGKLKYREQIVDGFENTPSALSSACSTATTPAKCWSRPPIPSQSRAARPDRRTGCLFGCFSQPFFPLA